MPDSPPRLTRRRVRVFAVATSLFIVGGLASGTAWIAHRLNVPGPLPSVTDLYIPPGSNHATTALLSAHRLIETGGVTQILFRLRVALTRERGALRSGEYRFPAHASINKIVYILRHAPPVQHHLTIAEGLMAREIRAVIAQAPYLSGVIPSLQEGDLLPQTISYTYGQDRAQVLARLHKMLAPALASVWSGRRADVALDTPRDLLILASIVERETARADERGAIARVFLNRLAKGMKLQSDPTVIYDISRGAGALGRPLTHADLAIDHGHNTYVRRGLPEGPICAPGLESLQAVAQAPPGDALYFVASGVDGRHVFSASLHEHQKAVQNYRHRLRQIKPSIGAVNAPD